MTEQDKDSGVPSTWAITERVVFLVLVVTALVMVTIAGQRSQDAGDTPRVVLGLIAFLLWTWMGLICAGQLGEMIRKRRSARKAERDDPGLGTGRWSVPEGEWFSVRWEPATGRYYVNGWIRSSDPLLIERVWDDVDELARLIEEAEDDGMVPQDSAACEVIRCNLDIPGWDGTDRLEAKRVRDMLADRKD